MCSKSDTGVPFLQVLLLYALLQASPGFRAYLLVRSDADSLLLPLLELLYATDSSSAPSRMYMVLIILLMLSQDTAWSRQVHRVRLGGRQVSWFRERSLQGTTLGEVGRSALGTPMRPLRVLQTPGWGQGCQVSGAHPGECGGGQRRLLGIPYAERSGVNEDWAASPTYQA